MSAYDGTIRHEPAARGRLLERAAVALLERALAGLEGGSLAVELPDGSRRSFGTGGRGGSARIAIRDRAFFRRVAARGSLGFGESYVAGEWDADDLVSLLELLLRNAAGAADRHSHLHRILTARPRRSRRNGLLRARRNVAYHYDLGNEFFALMLDETLTYSCAVFPDARASLADAQREKYRRICERLELGPRDRVLEIGCGWGGFARYAAERHGCRVVGLTLSHEQAAVAGERTRGLPVEIREEDYRRHEGSYTKVVSIEMVEAIGDRQLPSYFAAIDRLLAPAGRAVVQSILVPDQRWDAYRRRPDWIERYVFPGCLIPSLTALGTAATDSSGLMIGEVHEIGPHYAETLRRWRANVHARIDEVRALGYDRRFERTWDFYLAFCEAAFRTRWLRDAQLTLVRAGEG